MKKLTVMVVAAMMATVNVNAQVEDLKHEIGLSYGAGVSLIGDAIGNSIGVGLFDAMTGRDRTNDKQFGTLSAEYFYHLSDPRVAVGAILSYAQYGEDVEYKGVKEGERLRRYITLMPSIKYYWTYKESFGCYTKLAVGATMLSCRSKDTQENKTETDSKLYFMGQASLLGLEAGSKNLRGFAELGVGEQGILLAGLRYKF